MISPKPLIAMQIVEIRSSEATSPASRPRNQAVRGLRDGLDYTDCEAVAPKVSRYSVEEYLPDLRKRRMLRNRWQ